MMIDNDEYRLKIDEDGDLEITKKSNNEDLYIWDYDLHTLWLMLTKAGYYLKFPD